MATVGKNILDNLTTGMYSDSKVIYREYIQNACDQIDIAINEGIIEEDDAVIDIYIDSDKRYISIKDNATGVPVNQFIENVGDIANSNKELGKNKGFRGIGRLCGLAYCKTLIFTTSYKGEGTKSIMKCDAQKMRAMLIEAKKYTLDEIWDQIVSFSIEDENVEEHYFEVEMVDINKENTDLLDSGLVKSYLSFIAPVPYKNTFIFRNKIYKHAKDLNFKIDEYRVLVNGFQIFKDYTTFLKEKSGDNLKNYDEISELHFENFYGDSGELLAWLWVGLSRFEKQIPSINQMRGIRVRSGNIQLGDNNVLQPLFKEHRGNYYFVGEVFAVSPHLIPNSQRDYFNENETRVEFEDKLRVFFYDVLHKIYYEANKIKNDYKKQEEYIAVVNEYKEKETTNAFINSDEQTKLKYKVEQAKTTAEKARERLDKIDTEDADSPMAVVIKNIGEKFKSDTLKSQAETTELEERKEEKKKTFITDSMSKLTRNERKIVSKILSIVKDIAPSDVAEEIINKIKEELK